MPAIHLEWERRRIEAERRRIAEDGARIRGNCQTLAGFMREAWRVLEPDRPLSWNWHLDAIAEHLEAVTFGRITRLLINVPPGSSKSLLTSVLWPAWEWGPMAKRSFRYLTTSFNDGPVKRDTRKTRDLILSEWFASLWPEMLGRNNSALKRAGETSYENWFTGSREGVAFGSLTSQRGDRLIIDDPHSVDTAESDTVRAATTRRFREGAINRLNDQRRSAIVVIMQRLHEDDISGTILKHYPDYVHLCLPMEFEPDHEAAGFNAIGFLDPRREDGELLDPQRFPRAEVEKLKHGGTTAYAYAGQYQQRPTAREGGLFKRAWFGSIIGAPPVGTTWVRFWDLAATKRDPKKPKAARTAGVLMGRTPAGRFVVAHAVAEQIEGHQVRVLVKAQAEHDGKSITVGMNKDPGQAGKVQAQDYAALLAGWKFRAVAEAGQGDKSQRAEPFAAQCEAGNVDLVKGDWNQSYVDELCNFPGGTFADQVDASSGAFGLLLTPTASTGSTGHYVRK